MGLLANAGAQSRSISAPRRLDLGQHTIERQCRHPKFAAHLMTEWLPNVVNDWTVGAGHFNRLDVPD